MPTKNDFLVQVYRADGDCTNGGVTSPTREFSRYMLYINMPTEAELAKLAERNYCPLLLDRRGSTGWPPIARPIFAENERLNAAGERKSIGGMFGGNFIYSSDSRFRDVVAGHPIAVHDRFESQRVYNSMSR